MTKERLLEALSAIDPSATTYEEWVQVGMALHREGFTAADWDQWSARDAARYHAGECDKKWRGFGKTNSSEVTAGTLVDIAKRFGFETCDYDENELLDWNSVITTDYDPEAGTIVKDKAWLDIEAEANQLPEETGTGWNDSGCIDELTHYISAMFEPDDYVGFVYESYYKEKEEKWSPKNHGLSVKAKDLLKDLEKAKKKDGDITRAVYSYKHEAGVWIRPNPLNGQGYGNKDVTAFRYALIESDKMPINQQIAIIRELQLPVKFLIYSGGKSVHALVKVMAKDEKEYRQRVDRIYAECKRNQFLVDEQNKNASRLSRMPGVWRGDKKQYIIDENIGLESYQAWVDWLDELKDTLPDIEDLDEALDAPHELTPVLIEDTLRVGHKMLIAGPSKAGKSFLLMELAVAIASGSDWLGKRCKRGKVLYINFEIDRNSFLTRFDEIFEAKGINRKDAETIKVWNLRGKTPPLNELAPRLIRRIRSIGFSAIILDPIYKVLTGDENNARDMAAFCNQFDFIASETGASIIYVHHHSKGSQVGKRSMDRASGSGVFARDPDAMIDMIELVKEKGDGNKDPYRLEATLREFKSWENVNIWFEYPTHWFDENGDLDRRPIYDGLSLMNESRQEQKEYAKEDAVKAYDELCDWDGTELDGWVSIVDIATRIGKNDRTVKKYFMELKEEFEIESGGKGKGTKTRVKRIPQEGV
jgi:hypothetical protein